MPEIKSNFAGGKMNKDVDERLVPNGEYRDALNIQVSTSEGSDVGTAQSILGNSIVNASNIPSDAACVGSIADEKNDTFYYFLTQPHFPSFNSSAPQPQISKNLILQHKNGTVNTVFRDIVSTRQTIFQGGANIAWDDTTQSITFPNSTFVETLSIGMFMQITASFLTQSILELIDNPIIGISGNTIFVQNDISWLTTNVTSQPEEMGTILTFSPNTLANWSGSGALGFNINNPITGINIIDDLLFWTDGVTEPKKINITNSLNGTSNITQSHTKLINSKTYLTLAANELAKEKHLTVIRKAPKNVLRVESEFEQDFAFGVTGITNFLVDPSNAALGNLTVNGTVNKIFVIDPLSPLSFPTVGSTILFNPSSDPDLPNDEYQVKATISSVFNWGGSDWVIGGNVIYAAGTYRGWNIEIDSIDGAISSVAQEYNWAVQKPDVKLFKNKFPRYSYRYKYIDGEYSSFAPFTDVIFEPGKFKYDVKEAYNMGMENHISKTVLFDYNLNIPKDVVEIDLLYKESNSPLVYTIDTIPGDKWGTNNTTTVNGYEVRPDQLRATLPGNQLLRAWDNVPRNSLAQEISGSRIIYGNYLQNYFVQSDNAFLYAYHQNRLGCDPAEIDKEGRKSLKSIRNYTLGVSYLDKYGRQTPVFTNKEAEVDITIDHSDHARQFGVRNASVPPSWSTHYKIFIKETSSEYYNLAMDRIYDARDGNIWISFPSSDRNKVDEETFLILKKGVEGGNPVNEKNRYKILAIENEAPEFIKTKLLNVGQSTSPAVTGSAIFHQNGWPIATKKTIHVIAGNWVNDALPLQDLELMSVKFKKTLSGSGIVITTQLYDVVLFDFSNTTFYKIELDKAITEDWLEDTGALGQPDDSVSMVVYRRSVENSPEFDGRFFAKVSRDIYINDYIVTQAANSILTEQEEVASLPFYYFADNDSPHNSDDTTTAVGSNGDTNTEDEWDDLLKPTGGTGNQPEEVWFIDSAYYHGTYTSDGIQNYGGLFIPQYFANPMGAMAHTTESNMQGTGPITSGYNKGIEVDTNGQAWIHLSYSSLKMSHDSLNSPTGGSLHSTSTSASGITNMDTTYHNINGALLDWGSYFDDSFEELCTDLPSGVDGVGGIKHWTLNSSSYNTYHEDVDVVSYLNESNKFQFVGDDDTVYIINAPVTKTYHVNYTGWQESSDLWTDAFEEITLNGINGMGELVIWWDNAHQFGHPRNRRITYHIPIKAFTIGAPDDPTSSGSNFNPIASGNADATTTGIMRFVEESWISIDNQIVPENPAIWETEPKEDTGLDIYYEAGSTFPLEINDETNYNFAPIGSTVVGSGGLLGVDITAEVVSWSTSEHGLLNVELSEVIYHLNGIITFHRSDGSCVTAIVNAMEYPLTQLPNGAWGSNVLRIDRDVSQRAVKLSWFNCYSWGNGVESNRIRDDYNQITIDKGAKASSTVDEPYEEEHRKYGLIYSGLYNSTSGVNNLNQFITAEKITKDINPIYGSIQKLHSRDSDLITLCEDKCLKILANKDAVFNADGNPQLTANTNVLGQTIPFGGEYGISKNPESFASESYRVYFTDKVRGTVMRLSKDGLTPISMHGMKDWFRDNLKLSNKLIGSYDDREEEYNITLDNTIDNIPKTVSFREDVKGWVSFKSFTPENAISCANEYYSFVNGILWKHYSNEERNNFYNIPNNSTIDVVLNDVPGSVKSFNTLNYEGSDSKIEINLEDNDYYNLSDRKGWYVDSIVTDLEKGSLNEFIEKEGKWFNYIKGNNVQIVNDGTSHILMNTDGSSSFDQASFAIQGLGILGSAPIIISAAGCTDPLAANYDPSATTDDGSCIAFVYGCMELSAINYYPGASGDDGSCLWYGCVCNPSTYSNGCTNATTFPPEAYNYNNGAGITDDGSCIAFVYGCTDPQAFNYNPVANADDGSCIPIVLGCVITNASNYNYLANTDDGSCTWYGCTNPLDSNYGVTQPAGPPIPWPAAALVYVPSGGQYGMQDDGSCVDGGCTDPNAVNYSISAIWDDGSCVFCSNLNINVTTIVLNTTGAIYSNGSIEVEPVAGADDTPYTYFITDSSGSSNYGSYSSGASWVFPNLPADTYTLTVTSSAGCTITETITIIDSVVIYGGCLDTSACNYDSSATGDCNGVAGGNDIFCCNWTTCAGCTSSIANASGIGAYNNQTNSLSQCLAPGTNSPAACQIECGDGTNNTDQGTGCCEFTIYGCDGTLNPTALNPTPLPAYCNGNCTLVDDGISCIYDVYGCTDSTALNYDPLATVDDGSCAYAPTNGCMDATACNYDPAATTQTYNQCVYGFTNIIVGDPELVDSQGNSVAVPAFYDSPSSPVTTVTHYLDNIPSTTPYSSCVLPCQNPYPADTLAENDLGLSFQSLNYNQYMGNDKIIVTLYKQNSNGSTWTSVHTNSWTNPPPPNGSTQFGHRHQNNPYPWGNSPYGSNNYEFDIYQADGVTKQMYAAYLHSERDGVVMGEFQGATMDCGGYSTFTFTTLWECDHPAAITGCTDPQACNYDPLATCDDGSCIICTVPCYDCICASPQNGGACTMQLTVGGCCAGPGTCQYPNDPNGGYNDPNSPCYATNQ